MTDTNLPTTTNNLQALGDKPYSYEWAIYGAKRVLAMHNLSGLELGQFLLSIKQNEPHGRLEQAYEEIGILPRIARRYISRFVFFLDHSDMFKSVNLSDLNGSKQDALRKLPDVVLYELIDEDGSIVGLSGSELKNLTAKELQQVLNTAQQALDETQRLNSDIKSDIVRQLKDIDMLETENEQLRDQIQVNAANSWPDFTNEIRMESSALAEKSVMAIDELERLLVKIEQPNLDINDPERVAHYSAAVISYWTNLRFIEARISRLAAIVQDSLQEAIDETPEAMAITRMDNKDIVRFSNSRNMLVGEFEREQLAREARRMAGSPKPKRRRSKKTKGAS